MLFRSTEIYTQAYTLSLHDALPIYRPRTRCLGLHRHGEPVVVAEPESRQMRYEIADPHLGHALGELVGVVLAIDESAPCQVDACPVPGCCEPAA